MKSGTPSFTSTRLLDQLRERLRYLHYSLQTEKAYLYWVRFFIRWHGRGGVMRHPRDMGAAEVEDFLNMITNERQVSPFTHNQALRAVLFQLLSARAVWDADAKAGRVAVETPHALDRKYPKCAQGGSRRHGQPAGCAAHRLSSAYKRTGIPRSAMRCLACRTV